MVVLALVISLDSVPDAAHSKRKLKLVPAGDGARLRRVLEIAGLHHKVTPKLVLSSTTKGKTHTGSRVARVR